MPRDARQPNHGRVSDEGEDQDGRLGGGFTTEPAIPGAFVVVYATDLEGAQRRVEEAGGVIVREIRSFPGGRRFHL